MNPKILGVIPARGGSKGIPKKNIKLLAGRPLLSYTIETVKQSKMITDFIVSTDSEEIRNVAIDYGAKIPFLRPVEMAQDKSLVIPAIQHALKNMEEIKKYKYDYVAMLQPTTPLRTAGDLDLALNKLISEEADGIISVIDVDNWHPMKMKKFIGDQLVDYEKPPYENPPRQILPKVYMVNGALYATKRNVFLKKNSFQGDYCIGYIMPWERSINIDTEIDFIVAEHLLKKNIYH